MESRVEEIEDVEGNEPVEHTSKSTNSGGLSLGNSDPQSSQPSPPPSSMGGDASASEQNGSAEGGMLSIMSNVYNDPVKWYDLTPFNPSLFLRVRFSCPSVSWVSSTLGTRGFIQNMWCSIVSRSYDLMNAIFVFVAFSLSFFHPFTHCTHRRFVTDMLILPSCWYREPHNM